MENTFVDVLARDEKSDGTVVYTLTTWDKIWATFKLSKASETKHGQLTCMEKWAMPRLQQMVEEKRLSRFVSA